MLIKDFVKLKTEDKLLQNAIIYKREEHLLKPYEKAVNDAARELVTTDPSLMFDRNALFEKSRQKVREDGYGFKKGFSRSKFHQSASPSLQPKNIPYQMIGKPECLRLLSSFN